MQAKHGAAAPSYPLFSSFFVANTSSCFPAHPLAPTHTVQPLPTPFFLLPLSSFSVPPSFFLLSRRATAFLSLLRRFLRRLSMLERSMLRYITYTLLPVHLFSSFFFSQASTRDHGRLPLVLPPRRYRFLLVYVASIVRDGTEPRCIPGAFIPPPWQTRKRALRRHRKISSALDFWQTAALASSTVLNSKFLRFYVRLRNTSVAFVKRKEPQRRVEQRSSFPSVRFETFLIVRL